MYDTLFSAKPIGNVIVKNRIVFAPTTFGFGGEELIKQYEAIAAGGCGLIVVGDVPAQKTPTAPSLQTKKGLAHYEAITNAIHSKGTLAAAQLFHSDGDWKALLPLLPAVWMKKKTPDDLRRILNDSAGPYISSFSSRKVKALTASYGRAAKLAKEAGFDLIQIHGDRMCGAFASSLMNTRNDRYGGSLAHRLTFALEAVAAAKTAGLPVEFKLVIRTGRYGRAGILEEDVIEAVKLLEMAGVDSFHVTLANHSALTDTIPPKSHRDFGKEGCFLPFAQLVKQVAKVPVCTVGAWHNPKAMDDLCKRKQMDFFAMSRQLLCDPAWCQKAKEGRETEIRPCLRCNGCLDRLMNHQGTRCILERGVIRE